MRHLSTVCYRSLVRALLRIRHADKTQRKYVLDQGADCGGRAERLILQFECQNGRTRLVIAGRALPFGNREIIFDKEGREAAAGTLVGEFRRPSWLKEVP
jgi:hypothetical protein